jgi:hypothetical protein
MTLRRVKEAALYAGFGFCSDVAATRFCLAANRGHTLEAVICNLVLMTLTVCFVRRAKDAWLMVAWIIGQSAGIAVAMAV